MILLGFMMTPVTGTTSEAGGEAVFEAVLTSEPTQEITLDLTSSNPNEGMLSTDVLVFDSSNWNEPQSFTVTGVDDDLEDGDIAYSIQTTISTSDEAYGLLPVDDIVLANVDDDGYAVLITPSEGSTNLSEAGGTDSYEVALTKIPTGDVEVTVTATEQTEISLDGIDFADSLILTLSDTSSQTVTVKAVDDILPEGTHSDVITHEITGAVVDVNYGADLDIADVTVQITDNDTPSVTIVSAQAASEESLVVGQFNLALSDPAPVGGVTVNYSVDQGNSTAETTDYQPLSGTVFVAAGETGATVNLIPTQDLITETPPETVVIDLEAGTGYDLGDTTSETIIINDDDIAGVRITESGSQTNVIEGQTTDTYTVELTSEPAENVTIDFCH